jgi:hypothetical protein
MLPGKTGGVDVSVDQNGKFIVAPTRGADEARAQMFANIHAQSASVMAELFSQFPDNFGDISAKMRGRTSLAEAFKKIDANGDGSVTPAEIASFNFDTIGAGAANIPGLKQWLPAVQRELGLGAGGEDWSKLPGVTRAALRREAAAHAGALTFRIGGGISKLLSGQLPAQLEGYCDGSVRNAVTGNGSVLVAHGAFQSQLQLSSSSKAWGGPFSVNARDGSSVQGILIGLLQPAPASVGLVGNAAAVTSPRLLRCVLIAPSGTGIFAGVSGRGVAAINWGDSFDRSFAASFFITPW